MRIPTFSEFIKESELHPLVLQDSTVVVDGLNFFLNSYKESGLPYELGCECHRYASYLRNHLSMFKKANIKCYFVFKGGDRNIERSLNTVQELPSICPVFMSSVYREVLDEMGFEYVTCEYDCKRDIIELAQALDCPVIGCDIEYCFSGLRYIPRGELRFNETDNSIDCRYFTLDKFLEKHNLNSEKIALFIVLTDENIFPEDFFLNFFNSIPVPLRYFRRNSTLLYWLSRNNREKILEKVSQSVNAEEMKKVVEEVAKAQLLVERREAGGLGAACLLGRAAAAAPGDPDWFARGVAGNHVAVHYVNLYRNKELFSTDTVGPGTPLLLSLEIVKYAYDLLTNFQNDGFSLTDGWVYIDSEIEAMVVSETYSIRKPEYEAGECVFSEGWGAVRELGLLQHFLRETLQLAEPAPLARLPADARLLALALLYFSRRKTADTSAEAACVWLSYTALSLVLDKCDKNNLPELPVDAKPIPDSTTDKDTVTDADCNTAAAIMAHCPYLRGPENPGDIDSEILHPFEEFQHCLNELNHLNALCGAPFRPTVYSRAYSGPLVYRLRRAAGAADWRRCFDALLAPAPTVYAFFNGLIEVYEAMCAV